MFLFLFFKENMKMNLVLFNINNLFFVVTKSLDDTNMNEFKNTYILVHINIYNYWAVIIIPSIESIKGNHFQP